MLAAVMDAWRGTLGSMACPSTWGGEGGSMGAGATRCRTSGSPSQARQIQEPPYTISSLKFDGKSSSSTDLGTEDSVTGYKSRSCRSAPLIVGAAAIVATT